jgi:hypothetical protein
MLVGCAVGSFLSGGLAARRGCANVMLPVGTSIQLLGIALLWQLGSAQDGMVAVFGTSAVFGLGVGVVFAAGTMTGSMDSNGCLDLATAQGALAQARMLGGCIGLSMCTVIFNNEVQDQLIGLLHPSDIDVIHRNPLAVVDLPTDYQPLVKSIYMSAFEEKMRLMFGISIIAFAVSLPAFSRKPHCLGQVVRQAQDKQLMSPLTTRSSSLDNGTAAGNEVHQDQDEAGMEIIELSDRRPVEQHSTV